MSDSGGINKYEWKHWDTEGVNCRNRVSIRGATCAKCLAEGRDEETPPSGSSQPDSITSPIILNILAGSCRDLIAGSFGHVGGLVSFGDNDGMGLETAEDDAVPVPYQKLPRPSLDGT